ncbi:methyltransferase domain-containing protein [Mycolicibacterium mucogenicum]|uniref:class I SAM-dependent methyltransferase n=1 Tax=Mycolicibacterium mucogenicum TaxID=56689 RepID=UPI00226A0A42|nr:methyltransferase domain-containing protein [Mycolicibacterium mucogenicum]MCX8560348.1 methyltransferase domain-containing protein [Mycolicibacterium mucogenicum]
MTEASISWEVAVLVSDVVLRYRQNYGLGDEIGIEQVQAHEQLEARLTRELLASTPELRWEVFSAAYTELYESLPWLNTTDDSRPAWWTATWLRLVPAHSDVIEVGSGRAALIRDLVRSGHRCVATEISPERGSKHLAESDGLQWHITDGIHLASFEPDDSFDVVISTQVIEHFHPDDLLVHFQNARRILRPGGRYLFDTPHRSSGPHDLSRVFHYERAQFMHLKEYTHDELASTLKAAGFDEVKAVIAFPGVVVQTGIGLRLLRLLDRIEDRMITRTKWKRILRGLLSKVGVSRNIWLAAYRKSA